MNTVEKGDIFEDLSFKIINEEIKNGNFAISSKNAKVFQKKGYYSKKRDKEIIFDLSIEIWPENAKNYSILYLIECKDYSNKNVPIGDIELFATRVNDIAELNGKAIFIAKCNFSKTDIKYAENSGMMLIEVNDNNLPNIILFRKQNDIISDDNRIIDFLNFIYAPKKISGLKKLSKQDIILITNKLIKEIDSSIFETFKSLTLDKIINYFEINYKINFEFGYDLKKLYGKELLGCYDNRKNTIFIDNSLLSSNRFLFVLAHEIGHFYLHRNVKINQAVYNNFQDSEYSLFENKHKLDNERNWIEWQANYFAANFILPEIPFKMMLQAFRMISGHIWHQKIYLNNQPDNIKDYNKLVNDLSCFFSTSKTSIEYRIEELDLIDRKISKDNYKDALRNFFNDNST